ncbi:probable BOI-related E3 ubiquitin-protein ligase 2 [Durio zibethinus]|uniref:Probable BOI-related E3 ubiquitin-protein ligase 2 n=1 Tax=Durio zibethinus TaxID=66656 RepID=A0A6P5XEN3_DURZI|nr:probable BOI-related E3 ubiquitin-protein ligase 2 [Durio zibethinus]XP_022726309.1 probable BOI-related E3 ubiquitin-protein ligase 2 [Durio zibethinus]XP_022726310.1 probable BOI-related E3 ubiquitin-protein ligase 2 [Durio zibethinus]XP_022726311.1 probable BOI-related E3 ubiquitin-protein ligase 2 [Durio zibethinus]XP_022726312.1 probable BOI-related E3 ubiquitin-protein ligase 2 [Durio zibethinus]XP_022726313.1 probable BOI-related E3 ubiquitin-protein ligase 2 [Durio zibethinus]XP_02
MLGGNNSNPVLPIFLDENSLQYQASASNQLQLFGSLPAGCTIDPVNYFGNEHLAPMIQPNKRGREAEDIQRQQKLQISLNYNICKEEADHSASIPNPNAVSTGLRLSYDDDERNSSVTSASGSMTQGPSMILSLGDNIRSELDRQKEEFDQYIKIQEEHLTKGIRDMKQRHMASFLDAIEKGVSKKLREKDIELETMNRKNRELVERIKQVSIEAHNWHRRAKYNESVVNCLKSNLQQVISQGAEQGKEGFGDSEVDDAVSYIDPNNFLSIPVGAPKSVSRNHRGMKEHMICRACKAKEVSILLMPCRHLCLCKDCDVIISICPVCQVMKTAGVQVYLS